ncbi:MAG TPA: hypothetical protein VIV40_16850 [Kofleriaceae bacterium]
MRAIVALAVAVVAVPVTAGADVSVGASLGAGAQGAATYGALDLRLDAAWPDIRLGLGVRGVWDDAVFRRSDWSGVESVVTLVRDFEIVRFVDDTKLALAAGALAPARIAHIVDGYRVALDDRFRTGVRAAAQHEHLDVALELDDVLDPVLIAGGVRYAMSPPYAMHLGVAIDPAAPAFDGMQTTTHTITAIEAGVGRRFEGFRTRADLGASVVAEIALGASAVLFANGAAERAGVTWTARGDLRAGTGTAGSLFGPLYRIERLAHAGRDSLWDRAHDGELSGASAGVAIGAAIPAGWLELGTRARPGLGPIAFASAGAPMGKWVQAGLWAAVGREDAAGAAEVRVAWAKQLFSALQVARLYRFDPMEPLALWSVTAWFGANSE